MNSHGKPLACSRTAMPVSVYRRKFAGVAALVLFFVSHVTDGQVASAATKAKLASAESATHATAGARIADFGKENPSADARHVADWVAESRNNASMDFLIVDKKFARVYVFDAGARLRGASTILLGSARGDDSVPGIGTRPIAQVRPSERTTPAGRFLAERGRNSKGEDVIWVDYDAAVSIHRVRTSNVKERRLERLATPTIADNRISYGCINVPVAFYESHVRPVFAARRAIVYVLPEVKSVQQVFGISNVVPAPAPKVI